MLNALIRFAVTTVVTAQLTEMFANYRKKRQERKAHPLGPRGLQPKPTMTVSEAPPVSQHAPKLTRKQRVQRAWVDARYLTRYAFSKRYAKMFFIEAPKRTVLSILAFPRVVADAVIYLSDTVGITDDLTRSAEYLEEQARDQHCIWERDPNEPDDFIPQCNQQLGGDARIQMDLAEDHKFQFCPYCGRQKTIYDDQYEAGASV